MPTKPFTEFWLRSLKCETRTNFYDANFPCLGLRAGRNRKSWFVEYARRRITIGRYPYMSLHEARQRAHQIIGAGGIPKETPSASLRPADVIPDYYRAVQLRTRPTTAKARIRLLDRHFLPVLEDTQLSAITGKHIAAITDAMLETPAEALNAHMAMLHFFNWCLKQEHITRNPMAHLSKPAKVRSRERVLSPEELTKILRTAVKLKTPYAEFILLIFHTGLRKTEAYSLRWNWIDQYYIKIPAEFTKNGREHVVANNIAGYFPKLYGIPERVFPENFHWSTLKKEFDALCGVSDWTHHDARRTMSTLMAEWELADVATVEAILNHVSGGSRGTVQRIYDRSTRMVPIRRAMTAWRLKLDELVDGSASPSLETTPAAS